MAPSSPPASAHQLRAYPAGANSAATADDLAYPLLAPAAPGPSTPGCSYARRGSSPTPSSPYNRSSTLASIPHLARRLWKPLIAISSPLILIILYACIHPHVPGLPALPKVHISAGDESRYGAFPAGAMTELDAKCMCGEQGSVEGQRLCEVYKPAALERSRLVQGSGARMRRVLAKAKQGKALKIGVLGGSVSACHGVHPSPTFPQGDPAGPGCYPTVLQTWFTETFPGAQHEIYNGAIGGMDSSYYAFCGTHHISSAVDLIILEFDVNDQPDLIYESYFDQLLRVLLELNTQPAIVILGAWSPAVAQDQGYGDPQIVHLPSAHYYDIAYISQKRMMWNEYLRFPHSISEAFYQADRLHPNPRGHVSSTASQNDDSKLTLQRLLADLLISYLETELCLLSRYGIPSRFSPEETLSTPSSFSSHISVPFPFDAPHLTDPSSAPEGWEATFDLQKLSLVASESRQFLLPFTPYAVPPLGMFIPLSEVVNPADPDPKSIEHIRDFVQPKLFCADANDKRNPMMPVSSEGWHQEVWNGEKHFWRGSGAGARIKVDIEVMAGRVAVYYYRSQLYSLGDAKCWVDDNEAGAVSLAGWWDKQYNMAVVAYIDRKVTPGNHYVTCEIMNTTSHPHEPEARDWRLVAVMAT